MTDGTNTARAILGHVDPGAGKIAPWGLHNGGKVISNVASGGDIDTNAANIGDVKKAAAASK